MKTLIALLISLNSFLSIDYFKYSDYKSFILSEKDVDVNKDGIMEFKEVSLDFNRNNVPDTYASFPYVGNVMKDNAKYLGIDKNENNKADIVFIDTNDDGFFDTTQIYE
ncbi:TPA: hypothetical protein HA235_00510 [Candidatus Woesearchaeota archaeon]|nr:hypothetical protein [Candidatus Woesearchaeota archaeon]HIH31166.1 hypothetical protein [Candidatus Woesearchaeota archaeon]HIH55566.1 hypothetical protein [Candidatus Woesearchaeota archaeon]HIJ01811.1 hypothetical protein [Candidatus Woesearchaeota archaeon]HIJ13106.1 hypothetical protein [Candidatus Woesearchaeota archaeon]